MILPHRRSLRALAKKYVLARGFIDRQRCETVNQLSNSQVVEYIEEEFPELDFDSSVMMNLERGLILLDSHGKGAFQNVSC